jgi:glycosyltransferase involved in cell wall biosynthesis
MKILFLPGSYTSPAARFRLWQFVNPLRQMGHEVEVRVIFPQRDWVSTLGNQGLQKLHVNIASLSRILSAFWVLRDAQGFDVIFMNRDLIPETTIEFLESWLLKRNPRLIFDFDDAIHLGPRENKLRKILPHFAWLTPGNEYLASFARQVNERVSVWPTVVDTSYYYPIKKRTSGIIRIGWSGSNSTLRYCLPLLENIISALVKEEDCEFIVIADVPPAIKWPGVKWRYIPWTPQTEVRGLQEIDIGLMPLRDEPFERGKCGLKAIQYLGVGIPSLVSPVGVNKDIVVHGENGFHCNTEEDWLFYLRKLINNRKLRKQMGGTGRHWVEKKYSVKSQLPVMIDVFEKVLGS